ncbi:chorismate mutase [Rhodovulum euryhalinum]|uniref:chorismate mutase n=1 Tax=Rhodovulum euryhalinum TaxID=35805 RepID=A0A4R2KKJ8_9RHOB|nr:chorismate mutase [Rhodovulum euryhalinum]TCO72987.1 chorismate mutase [Rhodovulum euryhalinum]
MIPPEDCRNMAELRAQIDALDADLVARLAERARYIDRAAELKPAEGLPARIGPRIDDVIRKVRARAGEEGLDPELAERLWRELIEWAIRREEVAMGHRKERA